MATAIQLSVCQGRIFNLETGPHSVCGWRPVPGACFMACALLSYRCGSDSSDSCKCSELIPVQVPVRVLSLEESTNQTKPTLLFTQMWPWVFLFTISPSVFCLGTNCTICGAGWDHVMHHVPFSPRRMNYHLFFLNGVEEQENKVTIKWH